LSRKKLIKKLREKNPRLNQAELETVIDVFTNSISIALKSGQECEIRNFGSFRLKKLNASANLRNPKKNELIYRPERVKVRFKASKKLYKLINE
jgi:nucleoid DNA-binding protein